MKTFLNISKSITINGYTGKRHTGYGKRYNRYQVLFQLKFNIILKQLQNVTN